MFHSSRQPGEGQLQAPLSPLAAWALSLGCAVGWGSFVMPGTTFLPQAGPLGTTVAFAVGSLAILVIAADYAVMVGVLPNERGMYAYVRHALGGANLQARPRLRIRSAWRNVSLFVRMRSFTSVSSPPM